MRIFFQKKPFTVTLLFILLILLTPHLFAAEIFKAKGKKAIVKLEKLIVKQGDTLVVHASGIKKADVRVRKIKRNFALVDIISGRVNPGDSVSQSTNVRLLASDNEDESEYDYNYDDTNYDEPETINNSGEYSTPEGYPGSTRKKFAIGLFGGMNYNIIKLKLPNNSDLSNRIERKNVLATGLGYSAKAALDYKILDNTLGLRAFTGWQHLHASSKDSRNIYTDFTECYDQLDPLRQEQDCELKLDLYTISVQLQYYPTMDSEYLRAWVGLGGSLNFVIKTRTNYALQSVNTMGTIIGAIGANVSISSEIYLAFQADYNFSLASSSTVQAHFISAKIGLMYNL